MLQNTEYLPTSCSSHLFYVVFLSVTVRALDVWGSHEALARERNLRKEVEREYQESRFFFFPGLHVHLYE